MACSSEGGICLWISGCATRGEGQYNEIRGPLAESCKLIIGRLHVGESSVVPGMRPHRHTSSGETLDPVSRHAYLSGWSGWCPCRSYCSKGVVSCSPNDPTYKHSPFGPLHRSRVCNGIVCRLLPVASINLDFYIL